MSPTALSVRGNRALSIGHLLMAIAFFMPLTAAVSKAETLGGGPLSYLLVVPVSICIGILIVAASWVVGKFLWMKSESFSSRGRSAVAAGIFGLDVFWIVIALVSGYELASFIVAHVSR